MNPLKSVPGTIIAGFVLSILIMLVAGDGPITAIGAGKANALIIWLHVFSGIIWIGLLYYFNFVQVPALGDAASDDGGPGGPWQPGLPALRFSCTAANLPMRSCWDWVVTTSTPMQ
jgi:hypothetical protein